MHRSSRLAALCILVGLATAGCSVPNDGLAPGSMVVAYPFTLPVFVDGRHVGTTNQEVSGLQPGLRQVSVGDEEQPEWMVEVAVESGQTVKVDPGTGASVPCDEEVFDSTVSDADLPEDLQVEVSPTEAAVSRALEPQGTATYVASLTADFRTRDKLPQTNVPKYQWPSYGTYGPPAALYPKVVAPRGVDASQWSRDRVIEVARKYLGTPYQHKHIPILGLDCSNFTAWVYNYGLGNKFTSSVKEQAATVGRRVSSTEPLQRGDLLYFKDSAGAIIHAGLYIDSATMIDESSVNLGGVKVKAFRRTQTSFAFARRVI